MLSKVLGNVVPKLGSSKLQELLVGLEFHLQGQSATIGPSQVGFNRAFDEVVFEREPDDLCLAILDEDFEGFSLGCDYRNVLDIYGCFLQGAERHGGVTYLFKARCGFEEGLAFLAHFGSEVLECLSHVCGVVDGDGERLFDVLEAICRGLDLYRGFEPFQTTEDGVLIGSPGSQVFESEASVVALVPEFPIEEGPYILCSVYDQVFDS